MKFCFLVVIFAFQASAADKCIQIFYDRVPKEGEYVFGRTHALYLQNLAGHFSNIQQYIRPIETYKRGDVEKCHATFYLGTHYRTDIPSAFLVDYVKTKKQVIWAGYNIWRLDPATLKELWDVKYVGLASLDPKSVDKKGHPHFYKYNTYKGETFVKYGEFATDDPKRFNAAFEIALMEPLSIEGDTHVVSWARHSGHLPETPYILRNKNHWYIAESPFSFITEEDRYLIVADLLFDMLDEPPRWNESWKPALFRLEDVHPRVSNGQLHVMASMLERKKVPYSLTIIPVFSDPIVPASQKPGDKFRLCTQVPAFQAWVDRAKKSGATFIFHGVTHQSGNRRNPWSGTTGHDFEFWDRTANKPMPPEWDNPTFITERLEWGYDLLQRIGVDPIAWLPPHYQASPQDYVIFSQLMRWTVGRVIYFPFTKVEQTTRVPDSLSFDVAGVPGTGKRLPFLKTLKVSYPDKLLPTGQFYPYEIYGDYYGQRIVPENVGNVQPYMNEQVHKTLVIEDLIRILRRNRVLRDNWGSFFIHPFQVEETKNEGIGRYPMDTSEIEKLIDAAREAGYRFLDLKTWVRDASLEKRPEPIETFLN